uniref:Aminopeptidase N n=1 Tax=Anopheles christyi TaxID=43041 RepID=A0A182K6I8_9DIPT
MSSYLLAFGVSDFVSIEDGNQQVYARPNAIHEADFALEAGVKILDALSEYTGVNYYDYMPKLTQMAIPDRGGGAMENWGLVKYGEPALLFNPARNTYRARKSIAVVISHEYSHLWFGDLVGPQWWSFVWMKEGFAELFGYIGSDLAYPEERYWDLYAIENIHNAFGPDATDSIRPMTQDATTPSGIAGLFDTIAYDKSGSVLNMFRMALGDDNFRAGLKVYLLDRQLDGAVADDLYAGLQAAIDGKDKLLQLPIDYHISLVSIESAEGIDRIRTVLFSSACTSHGAKKKMMTRNTVLMITMVCLLASPTTHATRPAWKWLSEPSDITLPFEPEFSEWSDSLSVPNRRQPVDESYRLPNNTSPLHYHLALRTAIHENNRQFSGTVKILFEVHESTTTVTLLNRRLTVQRAFLHEEATGGGAGAELEQVSHSTNPETEHLTLTLSRLLPAGSRYYLRVEFQGALQNNNNMGFFASSYLDDGGNRRYLASSKFEPTHARSAFPCYDEPLLKATFELELTHYKEYNAVANMPQVGPPTPDPDNADYVTSRFQITPKMSTYLLAFAVSDFTIRTADKQTVYARANVFEETAYPLEAGNRILDTLGEYMDISYYDFMPKMTQIAIPDRGTGAMENWGLVAYGEPVLLFNPAINSYRNRKSVTTIIAHEYAHQWFGNLVSPHWWEYIWLNEGFATLYEYYAAQLAYPEGQYWELFTVEVIQNAFASDASETVRPMNWNAATPNEIAGLFDTVAYDKSGSVLNMFRMVLGDDIWRYGLKAYMTARQLDGATAEHLYSGLQQALVSFAPSLLPATVTVRQLMESWTSEPGFPVLNVYRTYGEQHQAIISQERFLSNKQLPNAHVYHIPYDFTGGNAPNFEPAGYAWLSSKADKISTGVPNDQWIIFNRQQNGYYRVNYDAHNWDLLIEALHSDPSQIHHRNRAQLVNDAYNLARADRIDFTVPLRLMGYLRKETQYAPWTAAGSALTYLNNKLRGTEHYNHFLVYVNRLLLDIYPTLAIDSVAAEETLLHRYLKQFITTWACRIGHGDCLEKTKQALAAAYQAKTPVHPDIATAVYCNGLVDATDEIFVWVYEMFKNSRNQAHRTVLIDALACSRKPAQLEAFLTTALASGSDFDALLATERTRIISAVYGASREGVDAVIDFLMVPSQVTEFVQRLGQSALTSAVSNIASRTNNQQELDRLNALLTSLGSMVPESVAASARSTVQNNFSWFNSLEGLVAVEFFQHEATTPQEL